jgi:L-threonylcarbamoyladenylate synthase
MSCAIVPVDPQNPDPAAIARAADVLRQGGLVAFPTETVYGLGADALSAAAVARIFAAKGRPATNPLIVHVQDIAAAQQLAAAWPQRAGRLAERFWPGPLTLVLPRRPIVPDIVTAGGPTVALRVPAHAVALALLRASGLPLAAPSANRSMQLSPTCAEHVSGGLADLVLDAGPTAGGLESTVLDVTTDPPRLLRPGLVTPAQLAVVVGPVAQTEAAPETPARSPGQMAKHYAPRTPLELVAGNGRVHVQTLIDEGKRVGWVTFAHHAGDDVACITMPDDAPGYASRLYAVLHELDRRGLERIVVDLPPSTQEWLAVHDRLRRAAG